MVCQVFMVALLCKVYLEVFVTFSLLLLCKVFLLLSALLCKVYLEVFLTFSLTSEMQEYAYLTRDADCLQRFIVPLLPLIKQCWIEEHCSEGTAATVQGASGAGTVNKQNCSSGLCYSVPGYTRELW